MSDYKIEKAIKVYGCGEIKEKGEVYCNYKERQFSIRSCRMCTILKMKDGNRVAGVKV